MSFELRSISAWRDLGFDAILDNDGRADWILRSTTRASKQVSQEFTLSGDWESMGPVGAYYFRVTPTTTR